MKLLVFSDSHRANITDMLALIDEEKPDAVAHLGDLVSDVEDIHFVYRSCPCNAMCAATTIGETMRRRTAWLSRWEHVRLFRHTDTCTVCGAIPNGLPRWREQKTVTLLCTDTRIGRKYIKRTAFSWQIRAASVCPTRRSRRLICGLRFRTIRIESWS